jgi:hypothetical protein
MAFREQYHELRAIHDALGRLRAISYALYIILGILAGSWASSPGWFGWPCEMSTSGNRI